MSQATQTFNTINTWHYAVGDCVTILAVKRQCTKMLPKLLKMLRVENNFNKSGLPYVCIALFGCLYIRWGGLEPFRRVLLKRNERRGPTGPAASTKSKFHKHCLISPKSRHSSLGSCSFYYYRNQARWVYFFYVHPKRNILFHRVIFVNRSLFSICLADVSRNRSNNCLGVSVASEQQHYQDLARIYKREYEFSNTRINCI